MKNLILAFACLLCAQQHANLSAQHLAQHLDDAPSSRTAQNPCAPKSPGSAVTEHNDLRSRNGELTIDLTIRNYVEPGGSVRYCYITSDNKEAPTLRLNPGDLLILNLKNDLIEIGPPANLPAHRHMGHEKKKDEKSTADPCMSGMMSAI